MAETFDYDLHVFRLDKLKSIVDEAIEFFAQTPVHPLPAPRFAGCGVYALYYVGKYSLYRPLATVNRRSCVRPIYVGKAVPVGRRKGRATRSSSSKLQARLNEHTRSIDRAAHLTPAEFRCRFIILGGNVTDLIVPVESELIRRSAPLWNSAIDGFGNHDPGSGRYDQAPSEWDVLHPGRRWVHRLSGQPPGLRDVEQAVRDWLGKSRLS